VELLTNCMNNYFTRVINMILSYDGDVIKFAGDSMIVAFYPNEVRQATGDALPILVLLVSPCLRTKTVCMVCGACRCTCASWFHHAVPAHTYHRAGRTTRVACSGAQVEKSLPDEGIRATTLRAVSCSHVLATKLGHMRMKRNGQVRTAQLRVSGALRGT
jgi:class 3 adenylate cyclase